VVGSCQMRTITVTLIDGTIRSFSGAKGFETLNPPQLTLDGAFATITEVGLSRRTIFPMNTIRDIIEQNS
jgi:hypothetical protein